MTEHTPSDKSQTPATDGTQPIFCQDCGSSLVKLDTWCTSRACEDCGKEVFFVRHGEDGGIHIEKGDKFHVPQIQLSLDPASGGQFSRYGLEGFLKQLFLGLKINSKEDLVEALKELETQIDAELLNLDCINHCDLENSDEVGEAIKILDSHGLQNYKFNLLRSVALRRCYTAIEEGDALEAVFCSHHSNIFKEYSLLENDHLKEIIWLGYSCYVDLTKNESMSAQAVKENKLINKAVQKIHGFKTEYLYALVNDDNEIAPRLTLSGIPESTLKALVSHELESRGKDRDERLTREEIEIKRKSHKLKVWGTIVTIFNVLILALYKFWP